MDRQGPSQKKVLVGSAIPGDGLSQGLLYSKINSAQLRAKGGEQGQRDETSVPQV